MYSIFVCLMVVTHYFDREDTPFVANKSSPRMNIDAKNEEKANINAESFSDIFPSSRTFHIRQFTLAVISRKTSLPSPLTCSTMWEFKLAPGNAQ